MSSHQGNSANGVGQPNNNAGASQQGAPGHQHPPAQAQAPPVNPPAGHTGAQAAQFQQQQFGPGQAPPAPEGRGAGLTNAQAAPAAHGGLAHFHQTQAQAAARGIHPRPPPLPYQPQYAHLPEVQAQQHNQQQQAPLPGIAQVLRGAGNLSTQIHGCRTCTGTSGGHELYCPMHPRWRR